MSSSGTTDIPGLIESEFEVMAVDDPEKMLQYSSITYVREMRTPFFTDPFG